MKFPGGCLEGLAFGIEPLIGNEVYAADFVIASTGGTLRAKAFDFVTLTIGLRRNDQHPEIRRGIAGDKVDDFTMGPYIESSDENVGLWLDEPPFEVTTYGCWNIVGDNDRHGSDLG